jgi:hypothetical protein
MRAQRQLARNHPRGAEQMNFTLFVPKLAMIQSQI